MDEKINEGLAFCYKTAKILKEKFPNDIMKITPTTIIAFSKENSRLLRKGRGSMSGCYAYFSNAKPHRVVIKQKTLLEREVYTTKYVGNNKRHEIYGNLALIELICHELAHHRTSGHKKGFKIKYKRLWDYMVNQIISGEYYTSNSLYNV